MILDDGHAVNERKAGIRIAGTPLEIQGFGHICRSRRSVFLRPDQAWRTENVELHHDMGVLLVCWADRLDNGTMSMQLPDVISVGSLSRFTQSMAQDKASVAVAKKTLDVQRSQGDAAVSLLKQAADFAVGSKAANGHIDGYA
jgi:hypothetical protein